MIETVFLFPKNVLSVIWKICCDFVLEDGSKYSLETVVEERVKAEAKYEDAVATG